MKKGLLLLLFIGVLVGNAHSQNIGVNTTGAVPNASAGLDISFTDKGLLIPRVALTATNVAAPVVAPATSLLVYNTATVGGANAVSPGFYYWDGTIWVRFTSATFTDTDDQTLSVNGDTLFIADGNFVMLQDQVFDGDSSPTNELQTITRSNDTLYLSNGGFAVLPSGVVDTDDQTLSMNGDSLFIADGNYVVLNMFDGDSSASNELQTLSKTGNTVTLSNGGGSFTDEVFDGDSSATNELQTLSRSNDTLFLSNGGFAVLPSGTVDTDDQTLSINGDTLFIADGNYVILQDQVFDGDSSPTNELQTLSFSNDTLYLSNGGFVVLPLEVDTLDWTVIGNAGTDPSTNFLGTTDSQDMVIRTHNLERMRFHTNGNTSIGINSRLARLYTYLPNTDSTTNYGLYNAFYGTEPGSSFGMYNRNYGTTNLYKYGLYTVVSADGTGPRYGIRNQALMNSASNSQGYGIYNYLSAYGTGAHSASYNYLTLQGTAVSTANHASFNLVNVVNSSNTSTWYGESTSVDLNAGTRYGEYKSMSSNSTYDGTVTGDYNRLYGSGDGINYGVYNSMEATGTGVKYGMRNQFSDAVGTKYGVYNYFPSGAANATIYGVYNGILNDGNGTKVGTYNYVAGGLGGLYGSYNYISPAATNSSILYGVYSNIPNSGTGTHYGVYASTPGDDNRAVYGANTHTTGWAGYFNGNGYWNGNIIFNETGTNDHDFRVEGDTDPNLLTVDASRDNVGV